MQFFSDAHCANPHLPPISSLCRGSVLALAVLLLAAATAEADVQTSLSLVSSGPIQAGGTATVDFGITFDPLAATVGTPQFIDNQTGTSVGSCTTDQNFCTELQFNTTASTLTSLFAEVVAANHPGAPNFYSFTTPGTFPLQLSYPNPGLWEVTVAGAEQEQFSELQCSTPWDLGVPDGSASCSTIQTVSFTGAFDPGGTPDIFVTVNPSRSTPEPASTALLAAGLMAFGIWQWRARLRVAALSYFSDRPCQSIARIVSRYRNPELRKETIQP